MLEKVALALANVDGQRLAGAIAPTGPKLFELRRDQYIKDARAALEAIREVPEEISSVAVYDEYDWAGRNFTAMIDAILSQSQEGK